MLTRCKQRLRDSHRAWDHSSHWCWLSCRGDRDFISIIAVRNWGGFRLMVSGGIFFASWGMRCLGTVCNRLIRPCRADCNHLAFVRQAMVFLQGISEFAIVVSFRLDVLTLYSSNASFHESTSAESSQTCEWLSYPSFIVERFLVESQLSVVAPSPMIELVGGIRLCSMKEARTADFGRRKFLRSLREKSSTAT